MARNSLIRLKRKLGTRLAVNPARTATQNKRTHPMSTILPRLAFRLLVPALALGAIAVMGEPLPADGPDSLQVADVAEAEIAMLEAQAAGIGARADAAAQKALHQSAAQMRWFVTLPANGRRCISDSCSG
jgi:hypothetical protein